LECGGVKSTKMHNNKFIYGIHPNDQMFNHWYGREFAKFDMFGEYMKIGWTITCQLKRILNDLKRPIDSIDSILDFASGYGRVTRFLINEISPEKITVTDVFQEAINFQALNFSTKGILSSFDPDEIKFPLDYEVIFCNSLFTHLPEEIFFFWLKKLLDSRAENGVLIFTTSSPKLLPPERQTGNEFYYEDKSRAPIDSKYYGNTHVNFSYVEKLLDEKLHDIKILGYKEMYINSHQDVFVIGNYSSDSRVLTITPYFRGKIEAFRVDEERLIIWGWAYSLEVEEVAGNAKVFFNEVFVGNAKTNIVREDVAKHFNNMRALNAGFSFEADIKLPLEEIIVKIQLKSPNITKDFIFAKINRDFFG